MNFTDAIGSVAKSYADAQTQQQQSAWGEGVQGFGMPIRTGSPNASVEAQTSYAVGVPGASGGGSMLWVVLGVAGVVLLTLLIARAV